MPLPDEQARVPRCCGCLKPTTAALVSGLTGFIINIGAVICALFSTVPLRWYIAWITGTILTVTFPIFLYGCHKEDLALIYPYVVTQIFIVFLNVGDFIAFIYITTVCSYYDGLCVDFLILTVVTGVITIVLLITVYGLMNYLVHLHRSKRANEAPTFPKLSVSNGPWTTQLYAQSQELIFSQPPPDYSALVPTNSVTQDCLEDNQVRENSMQNRPSAAEASTLPIRYHACTDTL